MTNIPSNNRGATAPGLLVAVAIAPFLLSSCLNRSDRETIEMPPAPVGDAAETLTPTPAETAAGTGATTDPAATATPAAPPYSLDDAVKYLVEPGDSLSAISAKHGVSISDVMTANKIKDANKIRSGQILLLPAKQEAAGSTTPAEETTTPDPTTPAPETETETETEAEPAGGTLTPAIPDASDPALPKFPSNE